MATRFFISSPATVRETTTFQLRLTVTNVTRDNAALAVRGKSLIRIRARLQACRKCRVMNAPLGAGFWRLSFTTGPRGWPPRRQGDEMKQNKLGCGASPAVTCKNEKRSAQARFPQLRTGNCPSVLRHL